MDSSVWQERGKILIHPSLRRQWDEVSKEHVFTLKIQNYDRIADAFGRDTTCLVSAALLARVQRALGSAGIASPAAEAEIGVILWDDSLGGPGGIENGGSDCLRALVLDIALEPIITPQGPVHLSVTAGNLGPDEGVAAEAVRRSYRSDMKILSPVLAAIGGFREAGLAGKMSEIVDVDVAWRPVIRVGSLGCVFAHEASLTLIKADGQLGSVEGVMEASDRTELTHLIDHYLVSRTVDELAEARGAASLIVPVSAASLEDTSFWSGILERLEHGGGVACDLIVEVKGSANACTVRGVGQVIAMLKRLGCRISFGKFGLCSTSLRDLAAFAPEFVTIDKHFLSPLVRAQVGDEPLLNLVGLARSLGAEVIIDGVDCVSLGRLANESGAMLQKGAWCGAPRFFRSWANSGGVSKLRDDRTDLYIAKN